jgi:hypothetical protein
LSLPHMLLHGTQPPPTLPLPLGSTVKVLHTLIVPLIYLISTEIYGTTEATFIPIETDFRTPTYYTPKTLSASTPLVTYTGVPTDEAPTDEAPTDTYLQLTQSANVTPTSTNYPESSNVIYSSAESITFLTSALLPAALSFL